MLPPPPPSCSLVPEAAKNQMFMRLEERFPMGTNIYLRIIFNNKEAHYWMHYCSLKTYGNNVRRGQGGEGCFRNFKSLEILTEGGHKTHAMLLCVITQSTFNQPPTSPSAKNTSHFIDSSLSSSSIPSEIVTRGGHRNIQGEGGTRLMVGCRGGSRILEWRA